MLWDSVLNEFNLDLTLPLSDDDWSFLTTHADRLRATYPPESLTGLFDVARKQWFTEGLEISGDYVYAGGLDYDHDTPSEEYLETGMKIAEQQIAKAGYRLAAILIEVYPQIQKFLQ
jgi:hypothetical protein